MKTYFRRCFRQGSAVLLAGILIFFAVSNRSIAADSAVSFYAEKAFSRSIRQEISGRAPVLDRTGKVYYLSNQGNDKWKGSKKRPFRTFKQALMTLRPGDTLYVRGGTYTEQIRIPSTCSGNKKHYITISNYKNERVVLDGRGKRAPTLLAVEGASWLRIRGMEFANARGADACAILVHPGSHHLIISENSIHDISVVNSSKEEQCANGILIFGEDAKKSIHDVLLYQNKLYQCKPGWAECISVTGNCTNINIIENTLRNIGNIGICVCGNYGYCSDAARDFPRKCLIYKNIVSKCRASYATAYGIYVDGGQQISIRNNRVTACSGGIEVGAEQPAKMKYATSDILICDNLVKNNIKNGITIGGYRRNLGWVKQVRVNDNICKNNGIDNAIVTLAKCSGVTLQGNTFCNDYGHAAVVYSEFGSKYTKNIIFKHNKYFNGQKKNRTQFVYRGKSYTSFDKWKRVVGKSAGTYQK